MNKRCLKYISAVVDKDKKFVGFIRADSLSELNKKAKELDLKLYGKIFGYMDENKNYIASRNKYTRELMASDW